MANPRHAALTTEQEERHFSLFSSFPTEIRFKIWRHSFLPRRVHLMRHRNQPALDSQFGALLLVNREANQIFRETYALCFEDGGVDGIYFNYALDNLCFDAGLRHLKTLIEEYPETMSKIQWLTILPNVHLHKSISYELSQMSSLRLITVRSTWWHQSWELMDEFEAGRWLGQIWNILECLRTSIRRISSDSRPTLSAVFSPTEVRLSYLLAVCETRTQDGRGILCLGEISKSTRDSLEIEMPESLLSVWPRSSHLVEKGWFAYEIK